MPYTKKSYEKPSICWQCKNAVPDEKYGCTWSISGGKVPVEGWDAEPTVIRNAGHTIGSGSHDLPSYRVKACPKFIQDDKKGRDTWDGVPEAFTKSTDKPTSEEVRNRIADAVKRVAARNRDPFGGNHGR